MPLQETVDNVTLDCTHADLVYIEEKRTVVDQSVFNTTTLIEQVLEKRSMSVEVYKNLQEYLGGIAFKLIY